jgi:UDP-N-acetylmuramate--L-alanine ligase
MRSHFAGVGGTGMSALALYLAGRGQEVSGSDRLFDNGGGAEVRAALEAAGVKIFPQDGSGIDKNCRLVVSTAIEETVPEVKRARELECPVLHRSEILEEACQTGRGIAVSGTSGKSTVTAMIYACLHEAGMDPSVVSGAPLLQLRHDGLWGNAYGGKGEWVVFEADESDGTLVRYHPEIGLLLNLDRDHKETSELTEIFRTFRSQVHGAFVTHAHRDDCRDLGGPDALLFGDAQNIGLRGDHVEFTFEGVEFYVPFPGHHTVENALAAAITARAAGVPLAVSAKALSHFAGVHRRHEKAGSVRGVTVFDDFAHNPAKVEAAVQAFRSAAPSERLVVLFQPHGYGPLRFLLDDFAAAFRAVMQPQDALLLLPVYDVGGTADRSISSADLAARIAGTAWNGCAIHLPTREEAPALVASLAKNGDVVASMGARDPSLPELAKAIVGAFQETQGLPRAEPTA